MVCKAAFFKDMYITYFSILYHVLYCFVYKPNVLFPERDFTVICQDMIGA